MNQGGDTPSIEGSEGESESSMHSSSQSAQSGRNHYAFYEGDGFHRDNNDSQEAASDAKSVSGSDTVIGSIIDSPSPTKTVIDSPAKTELGMTRKNLLAVLSRPSSQMQLRSTRPAFRSRLCSTRPTRRDFLVTLTNFLPRGTS